MTPTTPERPGPGGTLGKNGGGGTGASNLGWSLAVLLRRWHEHTEAALADLPHGSRGYHVLAAAARGDAPTQAALAERLLIDRSVMTYLIDDLESADLVRRRPDPGDRRVRRVCPTEHGNEVLARANTMVEHIEERVLGGLDPDTRALFHAAAARAATAVQESSPDTDPCAAVIQVTGKSGV
ncbi:MarR family winged helix-turn-helix transcriptional regulator [Nocardiopsis valliformis]|uniref:MarR family winged helix-turn-helix transcriptional regulator n=1 Tax=Nocardiopsis valliformis TaxID=239974 RepID=UPI0003469A87|nr:MarR family winged helix-turn-helix transcriptional regulator [Nocardiopsis valliformis]